MESRPTKSPNFFKGVNEMKKCFVTTLICLVLIASVAYGAIIHVPGDYPTIQAGIDAAVDGDTVLVADGTWTGPDNKNLDFNGKAITVTSENGAEYCIIDCNSDGRGFDFHSGESENSVVSGFTIKNGYVSFESGGGVRCLSASPTITNNIIRNCNPYGHGGGVGCQGGASPTIANNIITENMTEPAWSGGGIYCDGASSPIIMSNTITKNSSDYGGGIRCIEYSNPVITNNVIAWNSGQGGGISCDHSSPIITNNTITRNDFWGIESWQSSPVVINTIIWNNTSSAISGSAIVTYSDVQGGWPGIGNINADPMFVDPNGDYHLQVGSPCIDAGTPIGAPPDDIEGNPRDEFPDMGTYEYQGVGTGSINGTVTDMASNPIKGVLVIAALGETKEKAFTDDEGYYEISNLEPGTYWVLCIRIGYKLSIRKAEVVAGETTTVHFRLREKLE
ncbi:hypothetical protein FJZ31_40640 [Candidatus Poribacteria bacterium]|nr:hypothetical protein [Candidatus Poribacteria bacterium]